MGTWGPPWLVDHGEVCEKHPACLCPVERDLQTIASPDIFTAQKAPKVAKVKALGEAMAALLPPHSGLEVFDVGVACPPRVVR